MMKLKTYAAALLAAGLLIAGTAGCGSEAPTSNGGKQTITFANNTDISTLDPRNANSTAMATILTHIYNGLLKTDENGKVVPDLAESYKQISPTEWEFTLKQGVTFQDGSPLTADDVKYTLDTIADPEKKFRLRADFAFMKAEVVDPTHVIIRTDTPYAAFPLRLTYVKIIPKAYVEKVGDQEFAKKPIGSGPYQFVSYEKGDRLTMKAYDKYFEGAPKIKEAVFRVIPEAAARIAALESGEVDIAANIPTSEASRLKDNKDIKVTGNATTRVVYIGINAKDSTPLQDPRVRQALNYAIDKNKIVDGVLDGYATPIATISTPEYEGYDASISAYPYDPAKAKKLLEDAGYGNGFSIDFSATNATLNGVDVVQAIADQLSKVNIKCNVIQEEPNQQRDKISSGQVAPLYITGIGGPYANLDLIAKLGFSTGERYSTYSNPAFDELRKKAITTDDEKKRLSLDSEIQKQIKEEAPAIFLWQQQALYAYNANRLLNWKPRVDEMIIVSGAELK